MRDGGIAEVLLGCYILLSFSRSFRYSSGWLMYPYNQKRKCHSLQLFMLLPVTRSSDLTPGMLHLAMFALTVSLDLHLEFLLTYFILHALQ